MTKVIYITPTGRCTASRKAAVIVNHFERMGVSLTPPLPAPHIIDGSRRGGGNGDSGAGVRK